MVSKAKARPLPAGWKAFIVPSTRTLAYTNLEYRLMEFCYDVVCDPQYAYPEIPLRRGMISAYQFYLDKNKGNNRKMGEVGAGWGVLSEEDRKPYYALAEEAKAKWQAAQKAMEQPTQARQAPVKQTAAETSDDEDEDEDEDVPAPQAKSVGGT
jgi:hypothetical protein